MLRLVALERGDLLLRQEIAHRRIDVLIRSSDVVTAGLEHRGERGHRRAADTDQMNALHGATAASSTISALSPSARRRARTPKGNVMQAPDV